MTASSFTPLIPPLLLASLTSISRVFFSGSPKNDAGPVTANRPPILMVPEAKDAVAVNRQTHTVLHTTNNRLIMFPSPMVDVLQAVEPFAFQDGKAAPLE